MRMTTLRTLGILAGLILLWEIPSLSAAGAKEPWGKGSWGVGMRQHAATPEIEDLPFGDGDISYAVSLEYRENTGFWQFALDYAPDISGGTNVDSVITPQLNLVFTQGAVSAGLGMLSSYVQGGDESRWTGVYWQILAGIHLPISMVNAEIMSFYVFKDWGAISELDTGALDYGIWLSFQF